MYTALVLQLELRTRNSEPTFIMTHFGYRLMMTTEQRPGERLSMGDDLLPEKGPHQTQYFWERVGDQDALSPLPILKACRLLWPDLRSSTFFPVRALAASVIKVAQSWATNESVTCRYHPVQLLTSY